MKRFKEFINESLIQMYKEMEFVCYNSDYFDLDYKESQKLLYTELKKIQTETDYEILPYMQDFSDDKHEEFSLSVIILNKNKEKYYEDIILKLLRKYNIELDLYNQVDSKK